MDRTERLAIEQPKKEVGLKTSHDKMDLVELPKFINFGCDMGLIGDPDTFEPMGPQPDLPPEHKASFSDEEKNKDVASELSVEVGWSPKEEATDIQQEVAEITTPALSVEEVKPATETVPPTSEETAKSSELTVGVLYFELIFLHFQN